MRSMRSRSGLGALRLMHLMMAAVLLFGAGHAAAQDEGARREDVEVLFRQGVDSYARGEFAEAALVFDRIIAAFPFNHRTTAAHVMKGKAQLMDGGALDAARTLRTFIANYPGSSFVPDAEYTIGLALLRASRFEAAVEQFLSAWHRLGPVPSNTRLRNDLVTSLDAVIDSSFNVLKLGGLLAETEGKDQRGYLWLKIAEKNVKNASIAAAEAALDTIARNYPATPFPERIAGLRARIEQRGEVRIGVLLPLMKASPESPAREIGVGLLNGIEFATEEYNSDPSVRVKVTLDVRDTERDPLATTRIVQELTANSGILAIVGPAFSNPALAAVGLANARGVPLITPTANSNGIASVGPNIFQANPDYETRGKAMARFAVQRLGHRTFAVLAPIDTYSKYMAESFMREALRLGARIVASEWYQRGASDFSMQLRNIRRTALADAGPPLIAFSGRMSREVVAGLVHLGVPVETVDSLLSQGAVVDAERLLGPRARFLMDSLGIEPRVTEVPVDSMESAVTGIDGFYVPIGMPEEIGAVASQIVYFNFETTLLGSGEWNSVPELDANKRYCTDVFFESDSYVDSSDPDYAAFVDRYFRRYKDRPGRNTLYGYDTMSLILSVIRSGAAQRAHLARDLALVKEYKGLHSRIGFSGDRVNSWLRILKFDGERIVPVEEIDVR